MLHAILRLCFTVIITMLVMVTVIGPARASTAVQDAIERLNIGDNHGALAIADALAVNTVCVFLWAGPFTGYWLLVLLR